MKRYFVALVVAVMAVSSNADVYKCKDSTGKTIFSDIPCPSNTTGGQIVVKPNTLDTSGSREQIYINSLKSNDGTAAPQQQAKASTEDKSKSEECMRARWNYDRLSKGNNSNAATASRNLMYSACGQNPPTEVTIVNKPSSTYKAPEPAPTITSCDASGCWLSNGQRVWK